jgi:acylphosphatase
LKGVLVFRASMKRAHARLVAPGVREIKHLRKHVVEESKRVNAPGTVLGWIRNDRDGSVEMLAEATDEEVLLWSELSRLPEGRTQASSRRLMWGTLEVLCEARAMKSREIPIRLDWSIKIRG